MSEAETIARGLTEAQREAVLFVSRGTDWREIFAYRLCGDAPVVNAARQLCNIGVHEVKRFRLRLTWHRDFRLAYRLTPLGLEVRRILLETSND